MQELYIQDILYTMGWNNLEYQRVRMGCIHAYIPDILNTMEFDNLEHIIVGLVLSMARETQE